MSEHEQTLHLTPRRVFRWQLVVIAALLAASTFGQLLFRLIGDVPILDGVLFLFWVDGEMTVPALYSGFVILLCSALFAWIAWLEREEPLMRRFWTLMAVVMAYIGADELLRLHEQAIDPVRNLLGITSGPLFFAWVIPAFVALAILGLAVLAPMRRLPPATRNAFLLAGTVYVTGAAGFEMIGAAYVTASGSENLELYRSLSLHLLFTTIEEGLEMLGMALLLTGLVRHLQSFHSPLRLALAIDAGRARTG